MSAPPQLAHNLVLALRELILLLGPGWRDTVFAL